jgi:hypothetical protein
MSVAFPVSRSESGAASGARFAALGLAAIAIALFALAVSSPKVLGDGDTWSHIATGDWILAHRAIPRADPFSYTMAGAPWTAHEWLAEVILAGAFRLAGLSGVVALTGAAAAAAALIVGLAAARHLRGVALIVTAGLGGGLMTESLLARPHMLALPLAAAWSAGLVAARDRGQPPSLWIVALMLIWANLHGGFIFGLALIVPFAAEAVISASAPLRLETAASWGLFACASLAAALVNPYGVGALAFPFRLMSIENLSRVSEWQAQDFSRLGPMEIALLAILGFALTRPLTLAPMRLGLLIALIAMALKHARHQLLLGLVAPMLLARPMAAALGQGPTDDGARLARVAFAATASACLALGAARLAAPIEPFDSPASPVAALEAVPPALKERPVMNDYRFGGYLIWTGVRPFIDARADMYGDAMLSFYARLASGDAAAVEAALKADDVAWTIFPPGSKVVATLDREPGWRRLYADAYAVVHVRDQAPPASLRGTE